MLRYPWHRCDQEHCYSRMMGCYYIVGIFLHPVHTPEYGRVQYVVTVKFIVTLTRTLLNILPGPNTAVLKFIRW